MPIIPNAERSEERHGDANQAELSATTEQPVETKATTEPGPRHSTEASSESGSRQRTRTSTGACSSSDTGTTRRSVRRSREASRKSSSERLEYVRA